MSAFTDNAKIQAIKKVKQLTGCGLKEAKDAVEEAYKTLPAGQPVSQSLIDHALAIARQNADVPQEPSLNGIGQKLGVQMALQSLPFIINRIQIVGEYLGPCCITKKHRRCALLNIVTEDGEMMAAPVAWHRIRTVYKHLEMILCFAMTKQKVGS